MSDSCWQSPSPTPPNPHLPMRQYDLRKRAQYLRHVIINIVLPSYFPVCFCAFTDISGEGARHLLFDPGALAAPDTTWLILHPRIPTMPLPRRCFFASWLVSAQCWPQLPGQQLKQRAPWCVLQPPKTPLRAILVLAPEHVQAARAAVENQSHTWYRPGPAEVMLAWAA